MNANGLWRDWPAKREAALEAYARLGGETRELVIADPAPEEAVEEVEAGLGARLPESFRAVLTRFSSQVYFRWFLPSDVRPPGPLRGIFSGECYWDLVRLPEIEKRRHSWVEKVFPNAADPDDAVWHNKLSFLKVANGDQIALDLNEELSFPVVYLSHELDASHGYRLGRDFIDFIDRWSVLGCPGAEDWQMMPFIDSPTSGIEPDSENARAWRAWFGL